jgi:hypothetical protein
MTEFRLNDVVEAFGLRGCVIDIDAHPDYPIQVKFDYGEETIYGAESLFTGEGKLRTHHKLPSLKLISRAKRKVGKEVKVWVNVYPNDFICAFHAKEIAQSNAVVDAIAVAVKCTGFYEVEIDE